MGTYGVICKLLCLRFLFAYFCSSRALYTCNLNYSIAVDYIKIGVKHVPHPHPKKKKVYWALVSRHMGVGDFAARGDIPCLDSSILTLQLSEWQ